MKSRKGSPTHWRDLCAELRPEDGLDDRHAGKERDEKRHADRGALRLCGQVARSLRLTLGSFNDPVLQSLTVISVTPAPDPGRLLVVVAPALPGEMLNPPEVLERLQHASGMLRSEVAAAISRKRAPQLAFQFIPGEVTP